jgi:hypothetical protein
MKVYHGSYTAVEEIDLTKCEPRKDFGQGFYVTKYKEQAESFAIKKHWQHCVITEFEFDEEVYQDKNFKVLRFDSYNDEWFDFVINNRKHFNATHDYDIIEGPVADDRIQRRIERFLRGEISREEFFAQLVYDKQPNHQICFCTLNSLQMLDFISYKIIFSIEDIGEKVIEQLVIDFDFDEEKAADIFFSSAVFGQLAEQDTKFYQKSWQEIYQMLKNELNI